MSAAVNYRPPGPDGDLETDLVQLARAVLSGAAECPAEHVVRHYQARARELGDQYALALWSRIRWQWVTASGLAEVRLA